MTDQDDELADAVDILRARGRTAEPAGDDVAMRRVDERQVDDAGLRTLAIGVSIMNGLLVLL